MTSDTLIEQIESLDWGEDSTRLFLTLTGHSACDEEAAAVVLSAAVLLARQYPHETAAERAALDQLCGEFTDLVLHARKHLRIVMNYPVLHVVGGNNGL